MANTPSSDAANIDPKFIPNASLLPRDNSGGRGFSPVYTQKFGDGGRVTGQKSHLSASGGGSAKDED